MVYYDLASSVLILLMFNSSPLSDSNCNTTYFILFNYIEMQPDKSSSQTCGFRKHVGTVSFPKQPILWGQTLLFSFEPEMLS